MGHTRLDSDDNDSDRPLEERVHEQSDDEAPSTSSREESSEDEEQAIEQKLAEVPLEVLARLKKNGRGPVGEEARAAAMAAKQLHFSRENKHRPQEMSSKRPVGRFREVIQVPKSSGRDPRFDATVNTRPLDKLAAAKRYSFLYDEVLPQEKTKLRERLAKERNPNRKRDLQAELTRMDQQLRNEQARRKKVDLEKSWKTQEKDAVAHGKKPYFLKKSEKKKLELLAKYEELKSSGRLEKYMAKRRKKNAAKDHRYLPASRQAMMQE